ncbi:MAG: DUF4129 domain-containing protein [Chitinophagaceae bacterium]
MKRSFNQKRFSGLLLLICVLANLPSVAQVVPSRDSSAMTPRFFNAKIIKELKADSDFSYQTVAEPAISLWDRFWQAVWNIIRQIFETTSGDKVMVWGLRIFALAVIAFFIWQLTKMHRSGMFNASRSDKMAYSISSEDIHQIDFAKEIAEAVSAGNFRLAVRLLYLQTLKKLSDESLISWRIDKTNLSYLNEVKQENFYQSFRSLTMQFENNWYGHIPIAREEYEQVTREFESLNNKLGGE